MKEKKESEREARVNKKKERGEYLRVKDDVGR